MAAAPWTSLPSLPEPLSNNATAGVTTASGCAMVSVGGLGAARTREAISSHAYLYPPGPGAPMALPDLPGPPRLAMSAVGLRGAVYVLGGYDVAPDAHETSHAELLSLDVAAVLARGTVRWRPRAPIPIAIDDAVALAYLDRYIIVVSGWSTSAPVPEVQIYDAERDAWSAGAAFPGTPVFGHTAAILGDELVVLDGVSQTPQGYRIVQQAYRATLSAARPPELQWTNLGPHPGPARYRAAGGAAAGRMFFVGGTADPYNYDGISYLTKQPSAPIEEDLAFVPATNAFFAVPVRRPVATMDHRSLAVCGDSITVIGGMASGPRVVAESWSATVR
jgi:hypothetical protein